MEEDREDKGKVMERWPEPKDKMKFLAENGYAFELAAANSKFNKGDVLTVAKVRVGKWHTDIEFEGVDGRFNSVMFELITNPVEWENGDA